MVVYGWSPGQAPITASMFRMNASMLKQMYETRSAPLREIGGEDLAPYMLEERHLTIEPLPHSVNPLAFHQYGEHEIRECIGKLGWEAPEDTDGNSSNCLLNSYANRLHLGRYGFHPYAFEVGGLVRSGAMSREEGLANLGNLGNESVLSAVRQRLGLED